MFEAKFKFKNIIFPYLLFQISSALLCAVLFYLMHISGMDEKVIWNGELVLDKFIFIVAAIFGGFSYFYIEAECKKYNKTNFDMSNALRISIVPTTFLISFTVLYLYSVLSSDISKGLTLTNPFIFLVVYFAFFGFLIMVVLGRPFDPNNIPTYESRKLQGKHPVKIFFLLLWKLFIYLFLLCSFLLFFGLGVFSGSQDFPQGDLSNSVGILVLFCISAIFLYLMLNYHTEKFHSHLHRTQNNKDPYILCQFDDLDKYLNGIVRSNNEGSFFQILFKNDLNLQVLIINNKPELHWVLESEGNIADKDLFIKTVTKLNHSFVETEMNAIKYLAIKEFNDLIYLTKSILKKMYGFNNKSEFKVFIEGFEYKS